ncbi:hypothetical protein SNARM312S_02782 [Streptomyces narbonensis]
MARTRIAALVTAAALAVGLTGCGAADMTRQASPYADAKGSRTVTLSTQSWVGAQANVAVAQYLLEHELGYRVDTVQIDEVPAWDALSQGRVDAILEDWGHPEQEKRYIDDKGTIARGGDLGVTGHIGWYVPTYFAEQHPDVTDWRNLNKYADEFRTAESGGKGQLLDGSPSYVTNDKALVNSLDLNYQVVFAGSEAAQITQIKQFAKEKKPFLSYWYKPQWLFEKVPMTEVKLPAYKEGCDADAVSHCTGVMPTSSRNRRVKERRLIRACSASRARVSGSARCSRAQARVDVVLARVGSGTGRSMNWA